MKHAACLLALCAIAPAWGQDLDTLLRDADRYRMSADNLQVETLVQTYSASGELDKERRYTVFAQAGRQSLVLMQSPAEQGQKVLMLGDDFWLLMPNSQRPLRITPMQKLLGDASTGDIATLSWSGDYRAELVGEEPCQPNEQARQCLHLSLHATRKGVTYSRIELWLGKTRHEPVRADLYVQSDKLATMTGRTKNSYMVEAIQEHLDDLEDLYLAEQRMADIRAGRDQAVPLEEVMKRYGMEG